MNSTKRTNYLAGLMTTAVLGTASATTVLIDFGRADAAAASPYNSAAIIATGPTGTTGAIALTDTANAGTGWTVTVTGAGSGNLV